MAIIHCGGISKTEITAQLLNEKPTSWTKPILHFVALPLKFGVSYMPKEAQYFTIYNQLSITRESP